MKIINSLVAGTSALVLSCANNFEENKIVKDGTLVTSVYSQEPLFDQITDSFEIDATRYRCIWKIPKSTGFKQFYGVVIDGEVVLAQTNSNESRLCFKYREYAEESK
jgi:hypothetical protein